MKITDLSAELVSFLQKFIRGSSGQIIQYDTNGIPQKTTIAAAGGITSLHVDDGVTDVTLGDGDYVNILDGTGIESTTAVTVDGVSITNTLKNTAVTPATYGDGTNVAQFTVDQQGRLTASADVPISFPAESDPVALAALTAHEGAADPHPGYQKESEKGAANGYCGLDAGGLVDGDDLPAMSQTKKGAVPATGVPANKFLRDDGTFQTPPATGMTNWDIGDGTTTRTVDDGDEVQVGSVRGTVRAAVVAGGVGIESLDLDAPKMLKREMCALADIGAATLSDYGFAASPTILNVFGNGDDAVSAFVGVNADNIAATSAGFYSPAAVTKRGWQPDFATLILTDPASVATTRIWAGLFSGDPSGGASPAIHLVGFRFDTGAGDTNWMGCTKDGTTLQTNDTGIAVAAATHYLLAAEWNGAGFDFYIDGAYVGTEASNLPGATTGLYWYVIIKNIATFPPPVNLALYLSRFHVRHY